MKQRFLTDASQSMERNRINLDFNNNSILYYSCLGILRMNAVCAPLLSAQLRVRLLRSTSSFLCGWPLCGFHCGEHMVRDSGNWGTMSFFI